MLCPQVVVVQSLCFFFGQLDDLFCSISELVKHIVTLGKLCSLPSSYTKGLFAERISTSIITDFLSSGEEIHRLLI
jgi:hypothetical protein